MKNVNELEGERTMSNYEKGDKFIIEVSEVLNGAAESKEKFYQIKGLKSLVINEKGLTKLEKLEEQNEAIVEQYFSKEEEIHTRAYNQGLNDAWKLALKLRYMDYEEKLECFKLEDNGKDKWVEIMDKFTPEEVDEKIREYENEQIEVGDVIVDRAGSRAIVTNVGELVLEVVFGDGSTGGRNRYEIEKTGEHFDIQKILKQLGGTEKNSRNGKDDVKEDE